MPSSKGLTGTLKLYYFTFSQMVTGFSSKVQSRPIYLSLRYRSTFKNYRAISCRNSLKNLSNSEPFLKLSIFHAAQDTGIHELGVFC